MVKNQFSEKTSRIIAVLLMVSSNIFLSLFLPEQFEITRVAWISIIQLIVNCVIICIFCRNKIFLLLFISFSWLFHCGQIVKYAFNIAGNVPLSFYNYGTEQDFLKAFIFYFASQVFLCFGCLIGCLNKTKEKSRPIENVNYGKLAKILILLGIVPRLYIDISRVLVSVKSGYVEIYSLYFPQMLSTIAFFCDAGCFLKLNVDKNKPGNNLFFLIVVLYKLFVMVSGARQYSFCFLIVWVVFYSWNIKNIKAFQKLILALIVLVIVLFVGGIGSIRQGGFSFDKFFASFSITNNSLVGDMLGEFGSGFLSLVVSINGFPNLHSYGYGKSYIAAIMSAVPKLVNLFPSLKESVTFTTLFTNTKFFGGSYLGEFYYNFSWFGVSGVFIVGYIVGKCQSNLYRSFEPISLLWSVVILMQFILFIRGYITDMAQMCIWLWLFIALYKKFGAKRTSNYIVPV